MRKQFIQTAIEEASKSQQLFKHGAIVVKNKKIISIGHNKVTSKCPSHMHSIHAEMAAIKQSHEKSKLSNSHVYVVRITNMGLADSKPCINCQHFMKMHGITRVFYSTGNVHEFESMFID